MTTKRYIYDGFELQRVTSSRLIALQALKHEFEHGYDAGCYIDDLDPEQKWQVLDELDNWARHIPRWNVDSFFESDNKMRN